MVELGEAPRAPRAGTWRIGRRAEAFPLLRSDAFVATVGRFPLHDLINRNPRCRATTANTRSGSGEQADSTNLQL